MLRKDRRGMALIFDALVFLTIISVISVALMNSVLVSRSGTGTNDYVSSVHEVVLGSSFDGEGLVSLMPVRDVLVLAMMSNDTGLLETLDRQISSVLDAYLSPLYCYRFQATVGGMDHTLGDENVVRHGDVFVSTIVMDENGARFVLSVSYA